MTIWYVLCFLSGLLLGSIAALVLRRHFSASGILKIDNSNPDKDIYKLEVNGDISKLSEKKEIIFRIDSHE